MTALQKKDGGVRGIATGTSFRRLVAKTLARQFAQEVEAACAPFQFALSTRAGTDCVGHAVRAATEANPQATVLSIDGVGAYARAPQCHDGKTLGDSSTSWSDLFRQKQLQQHDIHQHEGGEQGDPLMPLLFSFSDPQCLGGSEGRDAPH